MRILFVNPPWIKHKDNIWNNVACVMPPLGLAWMAAVLEGQGHEVRILDAHAERVDLEHFPDRFKELGKFEMVGITATTPLISHAYEISRMVKEQQPEAKVVLGGVHPTVLPEEVLGVKWVDIVVRGEGEETITELAANKPLEEVAGISFRLEGRIHHNSERPLIKDLDSLPLPAYHLLPMEKYYPAAGAAKRRPAMSMLATRGCPGRCTFCYRIFGNSLRVRSGRKLAEEAKFLHDNYGIREICFYDDTFTVRKKEVYAFCDGLEELKLDMTWVCFSRVDTIDKELLFRMKEMGCHQVSFGVESASNVILRNVRKRIDIKKVEQTMEITKQVGLDRRVAFMFGNPGETEETMQKTLEFAIRLDPEIVMFNITTPFPGTELFEWADKKGYLITKNWEHYDFAHPVMELPTISNEKIKVFYRKAYRKFFLRPKYLFKRLVRLRHPNDFIDALRAFRAVIEI